MVAENILDLSALDNLSEAEREYALKILEDLAKSEGNSKLYDDLKYADYNEVPVDIETFLTNDYYLGQAWKDATGKLKLYDFWMERLKELFPTNIDTAYNTLLESGARGIGKSEVACGCVGAYLMYRVMCLKNPLEYFHLKQTEKICFAFMNIKLALAEEIAISKFQKTIQMSPWFMSKGKLTSYHSKPYWVPPDPIQIIIGSQSDDVIGQPIFFSFFDEISFIKNQDIDKQKAKAKDMIDTAIGGMFTRFIHNGKNPTMLVVASSKRSEQSFMEEYIKTLSKTEGNSTMVVDKPVWEVKPKGTYSEETFKIALGNKFLQSMVIPDGDDPEIYLAKGYKIIERMFFLMKKTNKIIALILAMVLAFSSVPLMASAAAIKDEVNTVEKLIQGENLGNLVEWLLKNINNRSEVFNVSIINIINRQLLELHHLIGQGLRSSAGAFLVMLILIDNGLIFLWVCVIIRVYD